MQDAAVAQEILYFEFIRFRLQIHRHIRKAAARGGNLLHACRLLFGSGGNVLRLAADALGRGIDSTHTFDNLSHVFAELKNPLADGERCGLYLLNHMKDLGEVLARSGYIFFALFSFAAPFLHGSDGMFRLTLNAADEFANLLRGVL